MKYIVGIGVAALVVVAGYLALSTQEEAEETMTMPVTTTVEEAEPVVTEEVEEVVETVTEQAQSESDRVYRRARSLEDKP